MSLKCGGNSLEQRRRLVVSEKADSPRGLLQEPHGRRAIQPLPVASALAQDRPNECERAVYGCVAASFRLLRFADRIDERPIDTLEIPIGQKAIEPTQLLLVFVERGLVSLLAKPAHRRVLPDVPRPIPKPLQPPDFAFQLVVQLLRLGLVAGLSRSSYSLTTGGGEVDPPDRTALSK